MTTFNCHSNFRLAIKKSSDAVLWAKVQCRENQMFLMEGRKLKTNAEVEVCTTICIE